MATEATRGVSPESATADKTDIPAPAPVAEASSLQQPVKQDFTERVKGANSPNAVRELLEEAKRSGLRAPKVGEETKPAEGNPAADIPPDLKALADAEATPAAETEEAAPAEETAQPEPTAEETEDEVQDDDAPVTPSQAKKLRLRLPEDDKVGRLAAAFMQRNRDMSMEAALDRARSQLGIKPAQDKATQEAAPKSDLPQTVEEVEASIQALRAERKKANTELRFEEASDLSDKLDDMIQHRSELKAQAEAQKVHASREYDQKFAASESRATGLYEFASKPDSDGGKRMIEIDNALRENGDPLYESPDKPLRIAQMVAAELNIAPRKKGTPAAPAKPVAPAAPAPAAPKKGLVPSGASRTVPAAANQKPAIVTEIEGARSIKDIREIRKKLGLSF